MGSRNSVRLFSFQGQTETDLQNMKVKSKGKCFWILFAICKHEHKSLLQNILSYISAISSSVKLLAALYKREMGSCCSHWLCRVGILVTKTESTIEYNCYGIHSLIAKGPVQ